jgi:hypothetical protein
MRIKHYSIFSSGSKTLNWEDLRNNMVEKHYFLPFSKAEYLQKVETATPSSAAQTIIKQIEKLGANKVFSLGCGIGHLEYQVKKFSDFQVVVSDSNVSVLRLKEFDIFDDALVLDVNKESFPVGNNFVLLFSRIDTELNDEQLVVLFRKCHIAGIANICFVPAELLDLHILLAELKILFLSILKQKKRVFCGYARSIKSFRKLWGEYYEISHGFGDNKSVIFLKAKS